MTASVAFKPLSKNDVAEALGVSLRTVENWVNDGSLPAPAKLGNRCYWHPTTFYGWLEGRLLTGSASASIGAAAVDGEQAEAGPEASTSTPTQPKPRPAHAKQKAKGAARASSADRMRAKDSSDLADLMR